MANRARARSTWAAGALSERLRRVSSWRSSAVSGRRGSFRWRDMGHLGARGSPHHYTSSHGRRPTSGAGPSADVLGQIHFPVSCTPDAQAAFDQAMKLQHSFWYEAAGTAFQRVRERDPTCVMAYWGEAMALLVNPFTVTTAANLQKGRALLAEARRIGAKSEREAGFIAALSELYSDEDPTTHRSRVERYEQAMKRLYERFPDDPEVGIYYALALTVAAPPTDKTYAR